LAVERFGSDESIDAAAVEDMTAMVVVDRVDRARPAGILVGWLRGVAKALRSLVLRGDLIGSSRSRKIKPTVTVHKLDDKERGE
jgi:hypothetical protein